MLLLPKNTGQRGFSLLEIIVAIAILGSLGVVCIQFLAIQLKTRQKITVLGGEMHALSLALKRMEQDIKSAYIPTDDERVYLNFNARVVTSAFYGEKDKVILFTQSYRSLIENSNQSNLAFVSYLVRPDPKDPGKQQLVRKVDTNWADSIEMPGVGIENVILPDLKNFQILYWDGEKFRETWDSRSNETQNKLPKMVKISLSSFVPQDKTQEQLNRLNRNKLPEEKQPLELHTIVYLVKSEGQKEALPPSWKDYQWQ